MHQFYKFWHYFKKIIQLSSNFTLIGLMNLSQYSSVNSKSFLEKETSKIISRRRHCIDTNLNES